MVHSQISQSKSYPSNERVLTADVRPQESQHTPLLPPTADGAEVEASPVPLKPLPPPGAAHLVSPLALLVAPPLPALQQPIGMLDWAGPEASRGAWSVCKEQHWESVPETRGNRLAQLPQNAFEETLAGGRKQGAKGGGLQCIGWRDLRECLQENVHASIPQREDESMTQTKQIGETTSCEIMPRAVVRKQRRNMWSRTMRMHWLSALVSTRPPSLWPCPLHGEFSAEASVWTFSCWLRRSSAILFNTNSRSWSKDKPLIHWKPQMILSM